jgi:hypothetical protein
LPNLVVHEKRTAMLQILNAMCGMCLRLSILFFEFNKKETAKGQQQQRQWRGAV